jgi:uncharacterized protein (TIGR00251 family)
MRQFEIRVKTNSKIAPLIEEEHNGNMTIYVHEPPIDGKANKALMELIAKHLGVPKSRVSIVRGQYTRQKLIRIDD